MSTITCEQALRLAGQMELSGEVLAARWHVHHCLQCQRMLSRLETQVAVLDDRLALQKLLGVDLGEAICEKGERVIMWLARSTRQVLAVAVRLSEPTTPLLPSTAQLATLGNVDPLEQRVIRQDVEQTPDGALEGKITFIMDLTNPEQCTAEVEINVFDRWDLSGIDVFLIWDNDQRQGQTDERGYVQLAHIPVEALGHINVIIHPPQTPTMMNGAQ
ncbi:MAG: hypothetical protein GY832_27130 [Chloroflexi bacterium]|nr:hypothetical protein [Chloroflexota bacterium]